VELATSRGLPASQNIQLVKVGTTQRGEAHGKYCVIGEEERVRNNRPCVIPREFFLIEKDTHELDDGQCWMRLEW
jgi:hypothetical protein